MLEFSRWKYTLVAFILLFAESQRGTVEARFNATV